MSAVKTKKAKAKVTKPAKVEAKVEAAETITAFKGFDMHMQCRGFQYKVGETFEHKGPVATCKSGLHSCENPLDVWGYYPPGDGNLFAQVEASGKIARHADDSKIASGRLTIKAAISLPDFIAKAISWVTAHCDPATSNHVVADSSASSATGDSSASSATGYRSASSATGYRSASSATGYRSASSATGDRSASSATGDRSASSATGDSSASSATGYRSASSATGDSSASSATGDSSASSATGDSSASSATGDRSASSATGDSSASSATGDRSASSATGDSSASSATGDSSASSATGYRSASSATGYRSASSATGYRSASSATGDRSASSATGIAAVALNTGRYGKARAGKDGAIVLCEHDSDGKLLHIRASKVGDNNIEADTYYTLKSGEFVKADAA